MAHPQRRRRRPLRPSRAGGFTLVEILIVVIILGILAAIVVPQFSSAAADTRRAALADTVRAVRQAIALYQAQHNGQLPDLGDDGWSPLTTATDATGNPAGSPLFGPYLQAAPVNPFTNGSTVSGSVLGGADWAFDLSTGRLTAFDANGNPIGGE